MAGDVLPVRGCRHCVTPPHSTEAAQADGDPRVTFLLFQQKEGVNSIL